jgi:hypothetical protein
MPGIEVQVTDDGPATFEVVFQDRRGRAIECDPTDLRLMSREIEELAFGLVHREEVRPLPAGAIRVRVLADEWGWHPEADEIAAQVARRILS